MRSGAWRWGGFGLVVAMVAIATLALPMAEPWEAPLARLFIIGFVGAGVVALGQQDGRRIGWLLVLSGLTTAFVDLGSSYTLWADEQGWPGILVGQWAVNWVSIAQFVLLIALVLLFPTGRPQGPRSRWLLRILVVVGTGSMLLGALDPSPVEIGGTPIGPPPISFETSMSEAVAVLFAFTGLAIALAGVVGLVIRYRGAFGVEKAQLRWFLFGVGTTLGLVVVFLVTSGIAMLTGFDLFGHEWLADLLMGTAILFIPVSIWIAMARYRLYDIDRIISRTVAYVIVLLTIGALYAGMVVAPVAVVGTGDAPDLLVAAATLVAAALFQPLARRVRGAVDRRFSRARYDAARTLEQLSARLRDQVDDTALRNQVVDAVTSTMQPTSVWVWTKDAPPAVTAP